ncbi:MAG: hypothetical protein AB7E80_14250 [Hyphomicrobiaceae bacterium]
MPNGRLLIAGLALMAAAALPCAAAAERFVDGSGLQMGRFVWVPAADASGPAVTVVSLSQGTVHAYLGERQIGLARTTVDAELASLAGGAFTVSSLSRKGDAEDAQVVLWRGTELFTRLGRRFAEVGRPVPLSDDFGRLLGEISHRGGLVVVTKERSGPQAFDATGPFAGVVETGSIGRIARFAAPAIEGKPVKAATPPVPTGSSAPVTSLIVSRADLSAYVLHDGRVVDRLPIAVENPTAPFGLHAITLVSKGALGRPARWMAFALDEDADAAHIRRDVAAQAFRRVRFLDRERTATLAENLRPGVSVILVDGHGPSATDQPLVSVALLTIAGSDASGDAQPSSNAQPTIAAPQDAERLPDAETKAKAARRRIDAAKKVRSASKAPAGQRPRRGPREEREPYPNSMYWPY